MNFRFTQKDWDEIIEKAAFTDEEIKMLELYKRGWPYVDIAAEMYISESKVKKKMPWIKKRILDVL